MNVIEKVLEIEKIGNYISKALDKMNIKKYCMYFDGYSLEDYEDFDEMPCVIFVIIPSIRESSIDKLSDVLNEINPGYDIRVEKHLYRVMNGDSIRIGGTI